MLGSSAAAVSALIGSLGTCPILGVMFRVPGIALITALLALLAGPASSAPRVLVVGDSWAYDAFPRFDPLFAERGYPGETAVSLAIPGLTAAALNEPAVLDLIDQALAAMPSLDAVHISIGGNDLLGGWTTGLDAAATQSLFNSVGINIAAAVDHVLAQRPDVQVVLTSYDYPNLFDTVIADPFGLPALMWQNLGQPSPGQINRAFFGNQGCAGPGGTDGLADHKRAVADARPRVHWSGIEGRMQIAEYGFCNIDFPTPTSYLGIDGTDPIHLSSAGYALYVGNAFDVAYAGLFAGPSLTTVPSHGGTLDFGPTRVGDISLATATARNTGNVGSRLNVTFGVANEPFIGGGDGNAHLFVNQATGAGEQESVGYGFQPTARGAATQGVLIATNAGDVAIQLAGIGVGPDPVPSATEIDMGVVFTGQNGSASLQVANASSDPDGGDATRTDLTLLSVTVTGPDAGAFSATGITPGAVIPAGGSLAGNVGFEPVGPPGTRTATLSIVTDAGAGFGAVGEVLVVSLTAEVRNSVGCD